MARWSTRNYTSEVSRISTKQLKTLIANPVLYDITSGNKKITAQVKGNAIVYVLPNDSVVLGKLDKTALSYGWRYWFICPHCHGRRASLYFTNKQIACRDCFNLHYASQSEDRLERLRRKIRLMRSRLFDDPKEYCNLFAMSHSFPKPKGMSRKRFDREQAKLAHIESIYWCKASDYIDRLMPRLVKK